MKSQADLTRLFDQTPINRHLGFRLVSVTPETAVVEMDPRPELIQEGGVVHGGVISSLADTASVYIFFPDLPPPRSLTSIEFKMNFLRPVEQEQGAVRATAQVVKRGRTVAVTEVEIHQGADLKAKGMFTYLFLDPAPAKPI